MKIGNFLDFRLWVPNLLVHKFLHPVEIFTKNIFRPILAKNEILTKTSKFDKSAGSVRNDDIWPEMSPGGPVDVFCTRNRYLKSIRWKKYENLKIGHFFGFWIVGSQFIDAEISAIRPKIGHMILPADLYGSKLFPAQFTHDNSTSFSPYLNFGIFTKNHPKSTLSHTVSLRILSRLNFLKLFLFF